MAHFVCRPCFSRTVEATCERANAGDTSVVHDSPAEGGAPRIECPFLGCSHRIAPQRIATLITGPAFRLYLLAVRHHAENELAVQVRIAAAEEARRVAEHRAEEEEEAQRVAQQQQAQELAAAVYARRVERAAAGARRRCVERAAQRVAQQQAQELAAERLRKHALLATERLDRASLETTGITASRFGTKRCPRCRVVIQKNDGCDHMTCTCRHQFFWSTLQKYP